MHIIDTLHQIWRDNDYPFLIYNEKNFFFNDVNKQNLDLSIIKSGDVVALIGDFDPFSIYVLLRLIEKKTIIVPLTNDTLSHHSYFFDTAEVDFIINEKKIIKIDRNKKKNLILKSLINNQRPGLILFSTGTTGSPKAILHDLNLFLDKYQTPRPTLRTLSFLLFDHIGGINTLLHTLFNKGTVISTKSRKVKDILNICNKFDVELLPTTPTFLRLLLISGLIPKDFPKSLKIITYGTERMSQDTLDSLCKLLPNIEFRQTYGLSELGILRVKSESRNSLFMKIGGEGVQTKIVDNILYIKSKNRMLGYLNAKNPFFDDGWFNTNDIVEEKDSFIKILGRSVDIINIGGLKFMASDVENVAQSYEDIKFSKIEKFDNPITGNHIELHIQIKPISNFDLQKFKEYLSSKLPKHMQPLRIKIKNIAYNHRYKMN